MAISEPMYGANCEKILKMMVKKLEDKEYVIDISTVMEETKLDRSTVLRIKTFLTKEIRILEDLKEKFRFESELSKREAVLKKYFGE